MSRAPHLSYVCPLTWENMLGSDASRYCDVCKRAIPNLSLMSESERSALLARAAGEPVCAAFYSRLSGELVTVEEPLPTSTKVRVRQAGAMAAAATALSFLPGCLTAPPATRAEAEPPAKQTETSAASPDEDTVVLMAFGMICVPKQPEVNGPAPKR